MPKSKVTHCTVELLDGSEIIVDNNHLRDADDLLSYVCRHIGTTEKDYFGLRYTDLRDGKISWLDVGKPLPKQLKKAARKFKLGIQFFPDTIHSLQDEITRYQFVLQTRENLLTGRWACSMPTQALLASYIVQAEFSEYNEVSHGTGYLDGLQFAHCQDDDFLEKVSLFHKSHKNMLPSDADWLYMKTARKMVLYGMEVFDVMDADGNYMNVGVDVYGIHILRMNTVLHSFLWPVISKIHYHGKELFVNIKMSPKEQAENMTIGFLLSSDIDAKRISKACNLYKEFSVYGSIRKSSKNNQSTSACSHISTRLMAKDFQRVSSLLYSQKYRNEPSENVEKEEAKEAPDISNSFSEEPSKESFPSMIDSSNDEVISEPVVEDCRSEPPLQNCNENIVQKSTEDDVPVEPSCQVNGNVHVAENVITDNLDDNVFDTDDEPAGSYNRDDDVALCETDTVKVVVQGPDDVHPVADFVPDDVGIDDIYAQDHVDGELKIVENGCGVLEDIPEVDDDVELDMDVLIIEESDVEMLLSNSNYKGLPSNYINDDFEVIENSFGTEVNIAS